MKDNKIMHMPYKELLDFSPNSHQQLYSYVDHVENLLSEIKEAHIDIYYNFAKDEEVDIQKTRRLQKIKAELINSSGFYKNIVECKFSNIDVNVKQKVKALKRLYVEQQVLNSEYLFRVEKKINLIASNHYKKIKLTVNQFENEMRFQASALKRKCLYGNLPMMGGELEKHIKELVQTQNQIAKENKFDFYSNLLLENQGMEIPKLKALIMSFEERTRELYTYYYKKESDNLGLKKVRHFDLMHLFSRKEFEHPLLNIDSTEIILQIKNFLSDYGFLKNKSNIQIEYLGKSNFPAVTMFKNKFEIKILINPSLKNLNILEVIFHEFGHALHAEYIRYDNFLFQGESTAFTEGMAQTIESLAKSREFLLHYIGLSENEYYEALEIWNKYYLLFIRRICSAVMTKIEIYENGGENINQIKFENDLKFLLVNQDINEMRWSYQELIGTKNQYSEARLIAFFIARSIESQYRELNQNNIIKFRDSLINSLWIPGGSIEWTEKIEEVLGNTLYIPSNGGLELGRGENSVY
ncbi:MULTISPECIES: hypothetical protein [Bacillus]|uniref:Peptidase M3A/M3B catalytic domain-containing protein n=1 Tax=Bacillus mycoides TaxID=1405 RepID=A0A3D9VEI7_BACMY|nr:MULTISPECIES: hypothetical protein [Bacillus]RBP24971.1 hypothetical protein DET63_112179 [Bacillus sp. DB-2]REF38550.1 hypothetical protein DET55_108179 [Bacillus mycoides]